MVTTPSPDEPEVETQPAQEVAEGATEEATEIDYEAKAAELEAQVAKLENDLRSRGVNAVEIRTGMRNSLVFGIVWVRFRRYSLFTWMTVRWRCRMRPKPRYHGSITSWLKDRLRGIGIPGTRKSRPVSCPPFRMRVTISSSVRMMRRNSRAIGRRLGQKALKLREVTLRMRSTSR